LYADHLLTSVVSPRHFRALVKRHEARVPIFEPDAEGKFVASFLTKFGPKLWPVNQRSLLLNDGVGGPVCEGDAMTFPSGRTRYEKTGKYLLAAK